MHTTIHFTPGQKLTCKIESLGFGGEGVAKPDGFTIFVPRTAPGDLVDIEIMELHKRHGFAKLLAIKEASTTRQTPLCAFYDQCHGCSYQHIQYTETATSKQLQIHDSLQRIGKEKSHVVNNVFSPTHLFHYRNKVTFRVDKSSGSMGYVSADGKQISDIHTCAIASPELNALWVEVRTIIQTSEVKPAYVILRKTSTGQLAVILSITATDWKSPTKAYLAKKFQALKGKAFLYTAIIPESHFGPLDKTFIDVDGPEFLVEHLHGIDYQVQPFSFFQVNHEVTLKMIEFTLKWAAREKLATVLDLYCGAGLFSLALAKHVPCSVTGVESFAPSIHAAQTTAKLENLNDRTTFKAGKAASEMEKLFRDKAQFDGCIVDPPRKGLDPKVVQQLRKLGVKRLLYVSCSPPTFARDVIALRNEGFTLQEVQPLDMFPQTYHVELMATFLLGA